MVSKTTLRSRITRMLHLPSALLHIISLCTLHNVVLTEWNGLYADWNWGKQSKLFKCFSTSCKQAYSFYFGQKRCIVWGSVWMWNIWIRVFFSISLTRTFFHIQWKLQIWKSKQQGRKSICSESIKVNICSMLRGASTYMVLRGKSEIAKKNLQNNGYFRNLSAFYLFYQWRNP